jgi:uroporphyrinogen-III synthase
LLRALRYEDAMKVIITRPSPDAESLAAEIAEIGADPVFSPVMAILPRTVVIDLVGVKALAFTSANGVRAFTAIEDARNLPVFAVGAATAGAARAAGFGEVLAADGDVESLASLIAQSKPLGPVLHLAGRERAGDLVRLLAGRGVDARRAVIYDGVETEHLSPQARAVLADETQNPAVVFFSPRSAALFLGQAARAGLAARLQNAVALCLSEEVAAAARKARWSAVLVAGARDASAVSELVRQTLAGRKGRKDAPR